MPYWGRGEGQEELIVAACFDRLEVEPEKSFSRLVLSPWDDFEPCLFYPVGRSTSTFLYEILEGGGRWVLTISD